MIHRLVRAFVRIALLAFLIAAIVALSGATVAAHNEQVQRAEYPAPGRLVDIGDGQLIHLRTWGTRNPGEPAFVLDSSAGMPSSEWAWLGPTLAERHFVVAYDRPGLAWSTGPDRPRDAMSAALALESALTVAGITPPYVVVAHSYGGFSGRAFTGTHLDEVSALVLLDSTDSDAGGLEGFALSYRLNAWRAKLGVYALSGMADEFWQLPREEQAAANAVSKWPSFLDTVAKELEAGNVSAAAIRPLDLSQVPLLVVCVPESPQHVAQQKHIASLSRNSTYVEQPGYHMGMLLDHDQARQTAQTIESFIASL